MKIHILLGKRFKKLNRQLHIKLFIFWLVAMQLISPFLHAHAFGIGAVNHAPGIHIHIDEIDAAAQPDFDKATLHNETIPEHSIGVTTGVSEKFEFELLAPVLFTLLSFGLYLAYVRRVYTPATAPFINPPPTKPPALGRLPHTNKRNLRLA